MFCKQSETFEAALSSISNFIENILDDEYPNFRSVVRKIENPVNEPVREKTVLAKEQVQSCLDYLVEHKKYEQACFLALAAYSGRRKSELARFKYRTLLMRISSMVLCTRLQKKLRQRDVDVMVNS